MSGRNKLVLAVVILLMLLIGVWSFLGFGPVRSLVSFLNLGLDIEGGVAVVYEGVKPEGMNDNDFNVAMTETTSVLSRRVDSFGLTEPNITREGTNRIRIELPGTKDINTAVQMVGKTAIMNFYLMPDGQFVPNGIKLTEKDGKLVWTNNGTETVFNGEFLFNGKEVKDAGVGTSDGQTVVSFNLSDQGAKLFGEATGKIVNTYKNTSVVNGANVPTGQIAIVLDNEVISAPTASQVLSNPDLIITGSFTSEEALQLATLIKGGALPIELQEVQTNLINATLGANSLQKAIMAGIVGFLLIFLFMMIRYKLGGLIASLALILYAALTFAVLLLLGATITLPGIAGLILSIGMAIDANVLILERLREELGYGKSLRAAVKASYHRAMSAIIDSNVTTIVAGLVLYMFGQGSVQGFAITLTVGVALSFLTAIFVTKYVMNLMAGIPALDRRSLYGWKEPNKELFHFDFMKYAKYFITLSLIVIVIGVGFMVAQGFNFGIDFTGGTNLYIDFGKQVSSEEITNSIASFDLKPTIVTSGDSKNIVVIKTEQALTADKRLEVFQAIQKQFGLTEQAFQGGSQFGPSIGAEISRNAMVAIFLSILGILAYVSVRFKFKYGLAAIVALVHDTLMMLTIYAIFRVTVGGSFIAAVLTIIGYSINDTIVIFDKIRENLKLMRGADPATVMNTSNNQMLTRTIFTSLTTFLVILTLYIFGADSIREFAFPLLIGTIVGSYSTIFIAGPLWVYLETKLKK